MIIARLNDNQVTSILSACKYFKQIIASFILILLLLCIECSSPDTGSKAIAGSETINERTAVVYMPDGVTRAANADVSISLSAKDSVLFTGTTDASGEYEIPLLSDNMYSISIEKKYSDSVILVSFQDSAYISHDIQTVKNDTLRYPCEFTGYIKLQPFDQSMKNYIRIFVQVLGTSKFTNVDSTGKFIIRNLAMGTAYNLKIYPGIQGYSDFYPEIGPSLQRTFSDTFNLPYSGIPPVTITELSYHPLTGTTKIAWNPAKVDNLLGYRVYRYNLTKVDLTVGSVAFTDDTVISDTVYSSRTDKFQYSITDTANLKLAYRISAITQRGEESAFYLNPVNMIQARSPLVNKMKANWTLYDSITQKILSSATINRTVAINVSGLSQHLPVDSVEYVNVSNDSVIVREKLKTPVLDYKSVFYMKWNSPGVKKILVKYADSAGLSCSYNFDTITVVITDYNLCLESLLTIPEEPVISKPFSARLVVRNIGTTALVNASIPVTLKIDLTSQIKKNCFVQELKPGDTISISIGSSEITSLRPGMHELTAIVDDTDAIHESNESDNIKNRTIEYKDVDLSIGSIFFDSSVVMEGDRVVCGAYIKNNGSTDYKTTFNTRVDFNIDENFFYWGYLLTDIKAGDSVKIYGVNNLQQTGFWYATKGNHSITVTVDSTLVVNESDETNNKKSGTVNVSDFNMKVIDFKATIDTLNQFDVELKSSIELKGEWLLPVHESIPLRMKFTCNNKTVHSFDTIIRNYNTDDTINIVTRFPGTGLIDSSTGAYKLTMIINPDREIHETCYTDNSESGTINKSCLTFNGHMENGSNDIISGWKTKEDSTGAIFKWEPAGTGVNGSRCISIECNTFNHAFWYFETKMLKGKYYRLTGWVRGENVKVREGSTSTAITIGCRSSIPLRVEQSGTFDWTYLDGIILNETNSDSCFFECNIGLGISQYYASGKVYFDNLKIQLVEDVN